MTVSDRAVRSFHGKQGGRAEMLRAWLFAREVHWLSWRNFFLLVPTNLCVPSLNRRCCRTWEKKNPTKSKNKNTGCVQLRVSVQEERPQHLCDACFCKSKCDSATSLFSVLLCTLQEEQPPSHDPVAARPLAVVRSHCKQQIYWPGPFAGTETALHGKE